MDVQGVGQGLADWDLGAGAADGILVSGQVEKTVGLGTGGLVGAEEGADVVTQDLGKLVELGAGAEGGESEVDEKIVAALPTNRLPVVASRYAADQGEGARNAAEDVADAGSILELDIARKAATR